MGMVERRGPPDHRWSRGETIAEITMIVDRPLVTVALTVVSDDPDLLALYRPAGTPYRELVTDDGRPLPRVMHPDAVVGLAGRERTGTWELGPSLLLTRPDAAHCVILNWSREWVFERWYVNLQRPYERFDAGIRVRDEFLDLIVRPDRSLIWKDEDELERAVAVGRITAGRAAAVWQEGRAVAAMATAGLSPFDDGWLGWRPDPAWAAPALPE